MFGKHRVASVEVSSDGLTLHGRGRARKIAWDDLQDVEIRTTDQGPRREDVFFVLRSIDGKQHSIGQAAAAVSPGFLTRLQALPGFDNEALIESMGSTGNATFCCWVRPPD